MILITLFLDFIIEWWQFQMVSLPVMSSQLSLFWPAVKCFSRIVSKIAKTSLERQQVQDPLNCHYDRPSPEFGTIAWFLNQMNPILNRLTGLRFARPNFRRSSFSSTSPSYPELDKTRKATPEVLPGLDLTNASAPSIEPPSYNEAVYQQSDSPVRHERLIWYFLESLMGEETLHDSARKPFAVTDIIIYRIYQYRQLSNRLCIRLFIHLYFSY